MSADEIFSSNDFPVRALKREDFLKALNDPTLHALFDHWETHCGPDRIMRKTALDPMRIPSILPHVFLMAVERGGTVFRYRLTGSYIDQRIPRNIIGKTIEEARRGPVVHHLNRLFGNAARNAAPTLGLSKLEGESNAIYVYKRLVMPMTTTGAGVDLLLGGWVTLSAHSDAAFAKLPTRNAWSPETPHEIVSLVP